jgi:hypothetical protein
VREMSTTIENWKLEIGERKGGLKMDNLKLENAQLKIEN